MSLDAPKLHWFSLRTRMHSKSRFVLYKESIYMHNGLKHPQNLHNEEVAAQSKINNNNIEPRPL